MSGEPEAEDDIVDLLLQQAVRPVKPAAVCLLTVVRCSELGTEQEARAAGKA